MTKLSHVIPGTLLRDEHTRDVYVVMKNDGKEIRLVHSIVILESDGGWEPVGWVSPNSVLAELGIKNA
jgi:hypothetical protein